MFIYLYIHIHIYIYTYTNNICKVCTAKRSLGTCAWLEGESGDGTLNTDMNVCIHICMYVYIYRYI